ncbi:hypothetical protein CXQ85_005226 [Candidozyma haemuli]|uniref:Glucose starvation modulator protein 1 n=1 Tax=Candidozyma haemuli TaxID=45357 RepID=A0A2V1AXW0_9ASCO|nr:hypothetical protein CXQ85_005226 [[Candida] haemuloni]PVH22652.1 hypothetical protein CXQ85_005226 [[Candida] haemuloni]
MTRRLTPQEKKARRPASRACTFCHSKHLQCSNTRPCQNCIKRGIADGCQDVVRKRAKYMTQSETESSSAPPEPQPKQEPPSYSNLRADLSGTSYGMSLAESIESALGKDSSGSTPSTHNFNSNFLNQEYMMLGDLISKPSSPSSSFDNLSMPPPMVSPNIVSDHDTEKESRPFISLGDNRDEDSGSDFSLQFSKATEDQYVSPLLSHHIYQTVQDIYSNKIIGFDYPSSYHSLTFFLKKRFALSDNESSPEENARKRNNLLIILKLIASYRPTFISAHKSLFKPFDFQFLEMSFQRCLLDYENLSKLNASPTIIWRRTGEIVSISNDLVNLLGLSSSDILSKRTFIIELMYDDESIVEYFRLFKSVAVGNLHSTIVTRCKLIKKSTEHERIARTNTRIRDCDYIEFCSAWTVKRDLFDIPMMIVGQFLPVLPTSDSIRTY